MIKILVTGAKGQVGAAVCEKAVKLGMQVVSYDLHNVLLNDAESVLGIVREHRPNYVINCASFSVIDLAEANPEEAYRVNKHGAGTLAEVCSEYDIPLLHLSTDYVFGGAVENPMQEHAEKNPVNVYGKSKSEGEDLVVACWHKHIILRVGWVFSTRGNNFVLRTWQQMLDSKEIIAVDDQYGCPTDAWDVARVLLAMVQQLDCHVEAWGTYHYGGAEVVSWKGFAEAILVALKPLPNVQAQVVTPVSSQQWSALAPRPSYTVLDCSKIMHTFGIRQRPWRSGLVKVINHLAKAASH